MSFSHIYRLSLCLLLLNACASTDDSMVKRHQDCLLKFDKNATRLEVSPAATKMIPNLAGTDATKPDIYDPTPGPAALEAPAAVPSSMAACMGLGQSRY